MTVRYIWSDIGCTSSYYNTLESAKSDAELKHKCAYADVDIWRVTETSKEKIETLHFRG